MLLNYPVQSLECIRHAEACRRRARAAADPKTRSEFLAMEERWRSRASAYASIESPHSSRLVLRHHRDIVALASCHQGPMAACEL